MAQRRNDNWPFLRRSRKNWISSLGVKGRVQLAVLQDLVLENKHNRLGQEYRAIQGYWSKKAKAKGILTARDLQRYLAKS